MLAPADTLARTLPLRNRRAPLTASTATRMCSSIGSPTTRQGTARRPATCHSTTALCSSSIRSAACPMRARPHSLSTVRRSSSQGTGCQWGCPLPDSLRCSGPTMWRRKRRWRSRMSRLRLCSARCALGSAVTLLRVRGCLARQGGSSQVLLSLQLFGPSTRKSIKLSSSASGLGQCNARTPVRRQPTSTRALTRGGW